MKKAKYMHKKKRPYSKPAFRSERLFEAHVLACGKFPGPPWKPETCTGGGSPAQS